MEILAEDVTRDIIVGDGFSDEIDREEEVSLGFDAGKQVETDESILNGVSEEATESDC